MTTDRLIAADRAIAAYYRMASEVQDLSLAEAAESLIVALFAWNVQYGYKSKEALLASVSARLANGEETVTSLSAPRNNPSEIYAWDILDEET